jgi:hypothetical protein
MKLGYEDIRIKPLNLLLTDLAGGLCILLVAFLFFSGVYGRTFERELKSLIPFIPILAIGLALGAAYIIYTFRLVEPNLDPNKPPRLSQRTAATLIACGSISFFIFIESHIEFNIERIHFVKYTMLGFLGFFSLDRGSALFRLLLAIAITSTIGSLDEIAQYFIPNRVFDLRDIFINVSSAIFGCLLARASLYWLHIRHLQNNAHSGC